MFRQDRTNPSKAVSNWKGRLDSKRGHPSTAVSLWLNAGLFGPGGNPAYAGYGGPSYSSGVLQKWTFDPGVMSTLSVVNPSVGSTSQGCCNNQVAGYSMSGADWPGGYNRTRNTDKMAVPAETVSTLTNQCTVTRQWGFGYADSGTAGYCGGGVPASGPYNTSIDKFTFASDTSASTVSGTIDAGRYIQMGMAQSGNIGYSTGGWNGTNAGSVVTKLSFSSGSTSTGTAISTATYGGFGVANGQVAGYLGGGYNMGTAIDKYAFPSGSRSTLSATAMTGYSIGFSNTGVEGFLGGASGSTQYRLIYASDTTVQNTGATGDALYPTGGEHSGMGVWATTETDPN